MKKLQQSCQNMCKGSKTNHVQNFEPLKSAFTSVPFGAHRHQMGAPLTEKWILQTIDTDLS